MRRAGRRARRLGRHARRTLRLELPEWMRLPKAVHPLDERPVRTSSDNGKGLRLSRGPERAEVGRISRSLFR